MLRGAPGELGVPVELPLAETVGIALLGAAVCKMPLSSVHHGGDPVGGRHFGVLEGPHGGRHLVHQRVVGSHLGFVVVPLGVDVALPLDGCDERGGLEAQPLQLVHQRPDLGGIGLQGAGHRLQLRGKAGGGVVHALSGLEQILGLGRPVDAAQVPEAGVDVTAALADDLRGLPQPADLNLHRPDVTGVGGHLVRADHFPAPFFRAASSTAATSGARSAWRCASDACSSAPR